MALLVDTFHTEAQVRLVANGWSFIEVSRYDPTVITGFTSTGRAFTATVVFAVLPDGVPRDTDVATLTLVIAGRTRTATSTRIQAEQGDGFVTALIAARNLFPGNQR